MLTNDSDVDSAALSTALISGPKNGTAIRNADGTFSYTPNRNFTGSDSFSYQVNDGELDSHVATVTITVVANKAPAAADDKAATAEDTAVRIDVLANDTDADGDRLSATVMTGPAHGKLTQHADGTWTYVPNKDWYGTDTFTYRANDGSADANLATVSITVAAVNDTPVAKSAGFRMQKDGSVNIDFSALIEDVDGDALSLTFAPPAHGTLTRNKDGSYTYRPAKGYTGTDSFDYTVSDGKLASTAKIALTIGGARADDCGERQASIVVKSRFANGKNDEKYGGIVVGGGANAATASAAASSACGSLPRVDWDGCVEQGGELIQANWVTDFLGAAPDQRSLAEKTGLVIKVKG